MLLLVEVLNDLEVMGADIQNTFLSAPSLENHWIRVGTEFDAEKGNIFIVVCALYGLKSAIAAF